MKTCTWCKEEKTVEFFCKNKRFRDGLNSTCKSCQASYRERNADKTREYVKSYVANDPDYFRRTNVARKYKLSWEDYQAMISRGCEVCGSTVNLTIDHDHACCPGENTCGNCLRGVLCGGCNKAEGFLGGDPEKAIALAAYLLRNQNVLDFLLD